MTSPTSSRYSLKKISFLGRTVPIICQNENGPCPLLAICNVLLLRGHITISADCASVDSVELLQIIAERLFEKNPPMENTELAVSQEKNLDDVISLLPRLFDGLDVNVRFKSVHDFEFTSECATFDLLDISLVHGWLIDPQDETTLSVVQNKSYNELVETLVEYKSLTDAEKASNTLKGEEKQPEQIGCPSDSVISSDEVNIVTDDMPLDSSQVNDTSTPKLSVKKMMQERDISRENAIQKLNAILHDGPITEEFLTSTASQLTYYGLIKLHEGISERQCCVFFRNNHFSTLFKYDNSLYLLVTDSGYRNEQSVVWETLSQIDGDTEYLDADFKVAPPSQSNHAQLSCPQETSMGDETADYLLALRLQDEEDRTTTSGSPHPVSQNAQHAQHAQNAQRRATINQPHSVETDGVQILASGELVVSEEQYQAQLEAERYYQNMNCDTQQSRDYSDPNSRSERRMHQRRKSKGSCHVQ